LHCDCNGNWVLCLCMDAVLNLSRMHLWFRDDYSMSCCLSSYHHAVVEVVLWYSKTRMLHHPNVEKIEPYF
jgi:hypothetical protein